MAVSKFDLAVMVVMAALLLRIEHDHRIVIATPAEAASAPQPAAVCPATDDVPFSADCITFIEAGAQPDSHRQPSAPAVARGGVALSASACPASNENAPYSANCIKFLSGWYWQADPAADAH